MSSDTVPEDVDSSANLGGSIIGADVALAIVASIAVALRFLSRRISKAKYWWDDWILLLALVFAWADTIMSVVATHNGVGRHIWSPVVNLALVLKLLWIYEFVYATVVTTTKMSLLLLYYRIFPTTWFRKLLHLTAFLVLGWWVAIVIVAGVQCRPYSYFWTRYTDPTSKGVCIDTYSFYLANGCLSIFTDFVLLLCPIPIILKLHMPQNQKWILLSIFTVAGFACVAGIIRVYFITYDNQSADLTWNFSMSFIWSSVEPCVGIVCACLPTLRPIIRFVVPKWFQSGQNSSSNPTSRSRDFYPLKNHTPATHSRLREDDEVYLTNDVSTGSTSGVPGKTHVYVQQDIEWSDSYVPSTRTDMSK